MRQFNKKENEVKIERKIDAHLFYILVFLLLVNFLNFLLILLQLNCILVCPAHSAVLSTGAGTKLSGTGSRSTLDTRSCGAPSPLTII